MLAAGNQNRGGIKSKLILEQLDGPNMLVVEGSLQ